MVARAWTALTRLLTAVANWRFFKPAVWVACVVPGLMLVYELWRFLGAGDESALGPDPNVTLLHETGEDALGFLLASLAVTPARRVFKINKLHTVRRLLGVTAFFYAAAHVACYLIFDQLCYSVETCDFRNLQTDLLKRKFIIAGMIAFSLLVVLAVTSTAGWMRRLKKNWTRLHRLVYVAAIAGAVHFVWGQKSDIFEPLKWAFFVAVLLGIRVYFVWQRHASGRAG